MDISYFKANLKRADSYIDPMFLDSIISRLGPYYGVHNMLSICMEELAELTQQVSKIHRGTPSTIHVIEEMADVYITIHYLKHLLNIPDDLLFKAVNVKLKEISRILADCDVLKEPKEKF